MMHGGCCSLLGITSIVQTVTRNRGALSEESSPPLHSQSSILISCEALDGCVIVAHHEHLFKRLPRPWDRAAESCRGKLRGDSPARSLHSRWAGSATRSVLFQSQCVCVCVCPHGRVEHQTHARSALSPPVYLAASFFSSTPRIGLATNSTTRALRADDDQRGVIPRALRRS